MQRPSTIGLSYNDRRTLAFAACRTRSMPMRNLVLVLSLLLVGVGVAVTSGVAHGQQDTPTINVYKSPT